MQGNLSRSAVSEIPISLPSAKSLKLPFSSDSDAQIEYQQVILTI